MNAFLILLLLLPALALGLWAHHRVYRAFQRWGEVPASAAISGADAARRILRQAGLSAVAVQCLDAPDGDHFDPRLRQACLSSEVFDRSSVTTLAVAAHECGHAIQHDRCYQALLWRQAVLPLTQGSANLLRWALMLVMGVRLGGLILVGWPATA
jgi:Zn-dependent membrane protease YugP